VPVVVVDIQEDESLPRVSRVTVDKAVIVDVQLGDVSIRERETRALRDFPRVLYNPSGKKGLAFYL
jgi:hypothetical protein